MDPHTHTHKLIISTKRPHEKKKQFHISGVKHLKRKSRRVRVIVGKTIHNEYSSSKFSYCINKSDKRNYHEEREIPLDSS